MEWILQMIYPVIKDCSTPEEARKAVIEWGKKVEPRDAALGLIAVYIMNAEYQKKINYE
jgi:hypothetical protein